MIPKRLVAAIVTLTSTVFAANFVAQFVVDGYEPDPAITAMFGAIVAAVIGLSRRDSGGGDGKPGGDGP